MDSLVSIMWQNAVVPSTDVSKNFGKRHDNVLRDIEKLIGGLLNFEETPYRMFFKAHYVDEQNGQKYPMYYMNRDGFSLLVMGFTGKKALEWKLKYIAAFNRMEKLLAEKQTDEWNNARIRGKGTRREFTDAIKSYVELAEAQGHHGTARFAYSNLSKLVKKSFGERENADAGHLAMIEAMEHVLTGTLTMMVDSQMDAKEIYPKIREKALQITGVLLPALE